MSEISEQFLPLEKLRDNQSCRPPVFRETGFNVFQLLGPNESAHSRLLAGLFDPRGAHGEGELYGSLLLEHLADKVSGRRPTLAGELRKFRPTWVGTEYALAGVQALGRIDIALLDEGKREAVVIENKIRNAPDMERQLPRYFELLQKQEYKVIAAVYLLRDAERFPPDCDDVLKERIIPVTATKFLADYLKVCAGKTADTGVKIILEQYRSFLMDDSTVPNETMKCFYDTLCLDKPQEKHLAPVDLRRMLNALPTYLAHELHVHCASRLKISGAYAEIERYQNGLLLSVTDYDASGNVLLWAELWRPPDAPSGEDAVQLFPQLREQLKEKFSVEAEEIQFENRKCYRSAIRSLSEGEKVLKAFRSLLKTEVCPC